MWTMPPAVLSRVVVSAVTWFLDDFTGSGTLATHAPDIGGAYTAPYGSDDITQDTLDGSGSLQFTSTAVFARSVAAAATTTYTYTVVFTMSAAGADSASFELRTYAPADDVYPLDLVLGWDGSTWTVSLAGWNSGTVGSIDFGLPVAVTVTTGIAHTIAIEVTPSGTTLKFDGAVKATSSDVPQTADVLEFRAQVDGGTTAGLIDYIKGTDG